MFSAWVSISALLATLLSAATEEQTKPVRIDLIRAASGMDTLQESPRIVLARTPAEWQGVWAAHKGATVNTGATRVIVEPAPEFNFEKVMILAVFSGEQSSAVQYRFLGAKDTGDMGTVRIRAQAAGLGAGNVGGRSYTFFILTKFDKALEVQVPRGNQWETVAEFPKVAAKSSGSD